jgi:hypothetical protein
MLHSQGFTLGYFHLLLREAKQVQKQLQLQVLRLTTPSLHPKEQRSLFGDPGTEECTWDPVR